VLRRNEDDVHHKHEDHTLNKKKRKVRFVSSTAEKKISNVDDQKHATLRKTNKFKHSVKFSDLFGFFRKKETCSFLNIPSWSINETYVNTTQCIVVCDYSRTACLNDVFSSKIRGKPIADLQWFNNKLSDHVCSTRYKNSPSIQKKSFMMRQFFRKEVFDSSLVCRFRGFYNPQNYQYVSFSVC